MIDKKKCAMPRRINSEDDSSPRTKKKSKTLSKSKTSKPRAGEALKRDKVTAKKEKEPTFSSRAWRSEDDLNGIEGIEDIDISSPPREISRPAFECEHGT